MCQSNCEESWAPKNWCFWTVVLEKTLESPLDCKEIQPVHPKGDQSWVLIGKTDAEAETPKTLATWCEELTHWKRPWCWEGLGAGGEGDSRGWDGWTVSPTWWTWVWVNSGSWWWTGRPGMLRFMGLQRVRHDWATELTELKEQFPPLAALASGPLGHKCWPYLPQSLEAQNILLRELSDDLSILVSSHVLLGTYKWWCLFYTKLTGKSISTPKVWRRNFSLKIEAE